MEGFDGESNGNGIPNEMKKSVCIVQVINSLACNVLNYILDTQEYRYHHLILWMLQHKELHHDQHVGMSKRLFDLHVHIICLISYVWKMLIEA